MQRNLETYIMILAATMMASFSGCSSQSDGVESATETARAPVETAASELPTSALDSSDYHDATAPAVETQEANEAQSRHEEPEQTEPRQEAVEETQEEVLPPSRHEPGSGWFENEVPAAQMGKPRARQWMDSRIKSDPEFESVITGKREVAKHDIEFEGGELSPLELAAAIVERVCAGDEDGLRELLVTGREFEQILWQEFPQSRPATNWKAGEVWGFHLHQAHEGAREGLERYSGKNLNLYHVTCDKGYSPYTNFTLYDGIYIHTKDNDGARVVMEFATTFVERKGRWKVYIYED